MTVIAIEEHWNLPELTSAVRALPDDRSDLFGGEVTEDAEHEHVALLWGEVVQPGPGQRGAVLGQHLLLGTRDDRVVEMVGQRFCVDPA